MHFLKKFTYGTSGLKKRENLALLIPINVSQLYLMFFALGSLPKLFIHSLVEIAVPVAL
jgi:hypothetical protein